MNTQYPFIVMEYNKWLTECLEQLKHDGIKIHVCETVNDALEKKLIIEQQYKLDRIKASIHQKLGSNSPSLPIPTYEEWREGNKRSWPLALDEIEDFTLTRYMDVVKYRMMDERRLAQMWQTYLFSNLITPAIERAMCRLRETMMAYYGEDMHVREQDKEEEEEEEEPLPPYIERACIDI